MAVQFLRYTPQGPLGRYVERLWLVSGGQARHRERILPSGTVELVVNLRDDRVAIDRTLHDARARSLSGAVVSGTYTGAFVVDAMQHESMIGVHFRPGGAFAVLGLPAAELTDTHVDVASILGDAAAREIRERLCGAATNDERFEYLEQMLTRRLCAGAQLHVAVQLALHRFAPTGSGASIRDVVRESGLSHRRFLTLFTTQVGLAPKRFCRILRFRHLHELARRTGGVDWAKLAQECGFFDQSHLVREFHGLAGLTPGEYQRDLQRSRAVLDGHVVVS